MHMLSEEQRLRNCADSIEAIANSHKVDIITRIVNYLDTIPFMGSMDIPMNTTLRHRIKLCLTGILILALTLISTSNNSSAAVPQHRPAEPGKMSHETHADKTDHAEKEHQGHTAPAHDMAKSDHKENVAGESSQKSHVHPVATEEAAAEVGLDEKLGKHIPLDLTFRDEKGSPVTLAELVTKPTIIAPVYYRCPNVCHFLQGDLARVLPGLKLKAGEDYQVISFSFDEKEQPELAKRSRDTYYAAMKNKYPEQAWRFLTADIETINRLTDSIGYRFQKVGHEFMHPVAFLVVSSEGMIVRYLHGTHVVPKDLTLALYEARSGKVGTTIRKMVQYCFNFDPEQKTYVFNLLRVSATAILATLAIFAAYLVISGRKSKKDKNL
jgi:protein SCO1/2